MPGDIPVHPDPDVSPPSEPSPRPGPPQPGPPTPVPPTPVPPRPPGPPDPVRPPAPPSPPDPSEPGRPSEPGEPEKPGEPGKPEPGKPSGPDGPSDARPQVRGTRVRGVQGAPSWVSLIVRDLDAAARFYHGLLGWEFEQGPERLGAFVYVVVDGHRVAGVSEVGDLGFGTGWTTFFGVRDAHESARRIADRGGTIGVGPVAIDAGRIVLARDPDGASFGLWQGPEDLPEASTSLVAGVPAWIELRTADPFKSALFYGEVLDWDPEISHRTEVVWEHERVVLRIDDRSIAAIGGPEPAHDRAAPASPAWRVFFATPDLPDALTRAVELGATVLLPATPTPYGPVAQLQDPTGARLCLIQPPDC